VTAAATAPAGCNSTSNNSNGPENGDTTAATNTSTSTQSSNADVFEAVEPTTGSLPTENEEGAVLDVALTDTSISAVTLRNSNGSEIARRELATAPQRSPLLPGLKPVRSTSLPSKTGILSESSRSRLNGTSRSTILLSPSPAGLVQPATRVRGQRQIPVLTSRTRARAGGIPRSTARRESLGRRRRTERPMKPNK